MLLSRKVAPSVHQGSNIPSIFSAPAHRLSAANASVPAFRASRISAAAGKSNEQGAAQPSSSTSSAASPKAEAALQAMTSTSGKDIPGSSGEDKGVAELARGMLLGDRETAEQMRRYEEALAQLEANKAAAAELERIFADAGRDLAIQEAQQNASTKAEAEKLMAEAEVAAAQKMLEAAEMEMAVAREGQREANLDMERKDSVKAGLAAAAAGLVFSLPLLLSNQSGGSGGSVSAALGLAASVASCFLFGVAYRYVVRHDVTNSHLRGGAVGAFGLVRAGSAADVLQATSSAGPFDLDTVIGPAALYAGESMLLFTFAAAVVEKAFDLGLVRRFGPAPAPEKSS